MQATSPWWTPELRTDDGYDVCGIVRAQLGWNSAGMTDDDLKKRKVVAEVERAEFQRDAEELKAWELQRQKELSQGNILPAGVYQEFARELLGMIRSRLEEIPQSVAENCPPNVRQYLYIPEAKQKTERDASPLQKDIRKLVQEIEDWLNQDPSEEAA